MPHGAPPMASGPMNQQQPDSTSVPRQASAALQRLGQAFARLMGKQAPASEEGESPAGNAPASEGDADRYVPTPLRIIEGMLFVGRPDNQPLEAALLAQAIGTQETGEVHQLVEQLNRQYEALGCPYRIASRGSGYELVLREEYRGLQYRVLGRMRQVRLSPAAVEVLALVAYKQPITADRIAAIRGTPSSGVLRQLVRRGLLRIERDEKNPRKTRYRTTPRLLEVLGISSLEDLPRSDDLEHL